MYPASAQEKKSSRVYDSVKYGCFCLHTHALAGMPGRSGLLAALCFLLRSNRIRTGYNLVHSPLFLFVFRVTASVRLYLTISAAYAAYSGSFFLCKYLLYKNEVTLTKMPKYDLIFQVSLSLCFSAVPPPRAASGRRQRKKIPVTYASIQILQSTLSLILPARFVRSFRLHI